MAWSSHPPASAPSAHPETAGAETPARVLWAFFALLAALTAVRIVGLIASPMELHGDEAQYWTWAQAFDWGYYSKPPLIAWTIATTTAMFGDAEWAIRLATPLSHAIAAAFLALLGRDLAGPRAGAAAGLLYATMPGVWLSAGIITTDGLLLPCVAAALFALNRMRMVVTFHPTLQGARFKDGPPLGLGAGLGIALGVGFLAKYAMIYVLIGAAVTAFLDRTTRRALVSWAGVTAGIVALAIIAPNLAWNAANDFATVSHTADNANWGGTLFDFEDLFEFLGDQFMVFGPLAFPAFILAGVAAMRDRRAAGSAAILWLMAFAVPILLVVSAQAFISRAHGNWAASAYAAGAVLTAVWLVNRKTRWALVGVIAVNVVIGGLLAASAVSPRFADKFCAFGACASDGFKRARGWAQTTDQVRTRFDAGFNGVPYTAVALDNRLVFHGLEYYGRAEPLPVRMWLRHADPKSHAETRAPLTPADGGPVLIVSERPREHVRMAADFDQLTELETLTIALGPRKTRTLTLFAGEGFAPLARDAAYEARFSE